MSAFWYRSIHLILISMGESKEHMSTGDSVNINMHVLMHFSSRVVHIAHNSEHIRLENLIH